MIQSDKTSDTKRSSVSGEAPTVEVGETEQHSKLPWRNDKGRIYSGVDRIAETLALFDQRGSPLARIGETTANADLITEAVNSRAALIAERDALREAIEKTLSENGHLADGETCTLIHLKRAIATTTDLS